MGKWGETCRELQLGEFLSHLVISFLAEDSPTNNLVNQYSAVLFSMFFFFPHMVSYRKFLLMVDGGNCRSVIFVSLFLQESTAHTLTLEMS